MQSKTAKPFLISSEFIGAASPTLLKSRHLLKENHLTFQIFDTTQRHFALKSLMMRKGTIVDATLIAAPPSIRNKNSKRDLEMHQSKKSNHWHFVTKRTSALMLRVVYCIPLWA